MSSRTAFRGSATVACFAWLLAGAAPAAERTPTTARLEWVRAEDAETCIDGRALGEAVDRRWGRRVFVDDAAADITVRGRVGHGAGGAWSVHLELERADGTRLGSRDIVSRATECSALDDAVALALGLMLDLTEREKDERSTNPREPVAGSTITIPGETIAPRVPWHVEPTLGGEAAVGLLPGLALGARFSLAIEPPRLWRVEMGGTIWQHREAETGSMSARLSMWTVDIAICPLSVERAALNAWACLAQRAGTVRAEGVGFDRNATQEDTFLAVETRVGATWAFASPLVVHAGFGLEAPLARLSFVYRSAGGDIAAVYRMSPVVGTLGLGIGARF